MQPTNKEIAFGDLDREIAVTRRVLERLPESKFAWKVHEKSMPLGRLAMHVANLLQWMTDTVLKDGMDMANPPTMRNEPKSLDDVLQTFDRNATALKDAMAGIDDTALERPWTLRNGPQVLYSQPKRTILRLWCLNHMVHHRAQLCVYLRIHN